MLTTQNTQNTQHSKSSFIPFTAMIKTFSKFSLVLIVLANISPALAASKYQKTELSPQKLDNQTNPQRIIVAGWLNDLKNAIDTVNVLKTTIDESETRDIEQREREQQLRERKRRQEELEAARRAATEKQIQEAERRRQYFDSLSPEQKQAYIQQQQALRQKQAEANLLMLGLFAEFLVGGSENNSGQQTTERDQNVVSQAGDSEEECVPLSGSSAIRQESLLEKQGRLDASDRRLANQRLYDEYSFNAKAGQRVSIILKSRQFDAYLLLLNKDGKLLEQNNDTLGRDLLTGKPTTESLISTSSLPYTGSYRVIVTSYDAAGQGDYELRVIDNCG